MSKIQTKIKKGSQVTHANHCYHWSGRRDSNPRPQPWQGCALPLSYFRRLFKNNWWRDPELNWGHTDFQSVALPTELSRHHRYKMAESTRLELATSGVTGRRSNQLSYDSTLICVVGGRNRFRTYDPLRVRQVLSR